MRRRCFAWRLSSSTSAHGRPNCRRFALKISQNSALFARHKEGAAHRRGTFCRLVPRSEVPDPLATNRVQGLQIESGTRIIALLVPITFRSPRQESRLCSADFGKWALAIRAEDGPLSDPTDHALATIA